MGIIFIAGIIGGAATFAALWPYGALIALIAAPFGASLSALLVGALKVLRSSGKTKASAPKNSGERHSAILSGRPPA
jgi:hypothetical protein